MTHEQIEDIVQKKTSSQVFEIKFKKRNPIKGLFIKTPDYLELKRKNLWRIVSERNLDEYKRTRDEGLARIFNGIEFTKLEAEH
jgi:hypothetical protein